ncbi:MAG: hypothetical protein H6843_08815 [Rhodospirillaceae bacterium]|nr:hypothetical protein [Rhodospirillaceae bacterium]
MSARDQILLKQLNISVSKLSKIVERPRQAIGPIVNSADRDFFDLVSIRRLYEYQCTLGEAPCKDAASVIYEHYADLAKSVISPVGERVAISRKGETWFLCTDWVDFLDKYDECRCELDKLIESTETTLVIIVRHHEIDRVVRYVKGERTGRLVFVVPCLLDLPDAYILCQRDPTGDIRSFSANISAGFTPTTQSKADRIRAWLERIRHEGLDEEVGIAANGIVTKATKDAKGAQGQLS